MFKLSWNVFVYHFQPDMKVLYKGMEYLKFRSGEAAQHEYDSLTIHETRESNNFIAFKSCSGDNTTWGMLMKPVWNIKSFVREVLKQEVRFSTNRLSMCMCAPEGLPE